MKSFYPQPRGRPRRAETEAMATIRKLQLSESDRVLGLALVREYTDATALELEVELESIRPLIPDYDEFPGRYHPHGAFLVAEVDGQAAGGVGISPLGDGRCEMNRLWVRPGYRDLGLGRELVRASLRQAAAQGFHGMALEVVPTRVKAVALYREFGFTDRDLFHEYEFPMIAMERDLRTIHDLV